MLNMIKADLYRIMRGKAIYVIFFIIIILSLISAIGISAGHIGLSTSSNMNVENVELMNQLSKASSLKEVRTIMKASGVFALDKDVIGQNINLYYMFIVIIVILICTDFSNQSIKNTLSSAITRKRYYIAKTVFAFLLCTGIILFNNYFFYIVNLFINGKEFSSSILAITKATLIQLPLLYGMISMLIALAFLCKKTSIFNAVAIPLVMVVQLVIIGMSGLFHIDIPWFYDYEFQFALNKLALTSDGIYIFKCFFLGIFYMILFHGIGYYTFKKTEIK